MTDRDDILDELLDEAADSWDADVPAGFAFWSQLWVPDANFDHPSGLAASNAVELRAY